MGIYHVNLVQLAIHVCPADLDCSDVADSMYGGSLQELPDDVHGDINPLETGTLARLVAREGKTLHNGRNGDNVTAQ